MRPGKRSPRGWGLPGELPVVDLTARLDTPHVAFAHVSRRPLLGRKAPGYHRKAFMVPRSRMFLRRMWIGGRPPGTCGCAIGKHSAELDILGIVSCPNVSVILRSVPPSSRLPFRHPLLCRRCTCVRLNSETHAFLARAIRGRDQRREGCQPCRDNSELTQGD